MRYTLLKEKCVALPNLSYPILIAHVATPKNNEIKLRLSRMRVVRTKEFAFGNSNQGQIKGMPLRQIERLRFAPKRNGNMFHESPKLSLRRFAFPLWNVFQIRFTHAQKFSIYADGSRLLVAMETTAIPAQITFTKDEGNAR